MLKLNYSIEENTTRKKNKRSEQQWSLTDADSITMFHLSAYMNLYKRLVKKGQTKPLQSQNQLFLTKAGDKTSSLYKYYADQFARNYDCS